MKLSAWIRGHHVAASFTALLVASLFAPRYAAAQHGHGGAHSAHGGGRGGGHSGVARPRAVVRSGITHGVTARRGVFGRTRLHEHALLVHHGLRVGVGLRTLGYRRLRHGYVHGYSLYGLPYLDYRYRYGYPYVDAATSRTSIMAVPPGARFAVPSAGNAGDSLVVEQISGTVVRVSWRGVGTRPVQEVALFLADAAETVLAVQTLHAAPFTALFEPTSEVALIGLTVVWSDGVKSTTLVPYQLPRR